MLKKILLASCIFFISLPACLCARENRYLGGGLVFESYEMELSFAGNTRNTRFESIQLQWYEQLLSHLDGGIIVGYLGISQPGNPITAGQTTAGQFLELDLSAYLYRGETFRLITDFIYRFSETSDSLDTQDIEWRWHEGTLKLRAQLALSPHLELLFGASTSSIDGEERATGDITQILDFGEKKSYTSHVGAQILLDRTGYIGIEIQSGSAQGGRIWFQRRF